MITQDQTAYERLSARFARLHDFDGALAALQWDAAVMMPKGAADGRGRQIAALERAGHDLLTAPETEELLDRAEAEASAFDAWSAANLREMRRAHFEASAIEPELVEALAKATTRAEMIWRDARANSDFASLAPALREVFELTRQSAEAKASKLGVAPYDALLDRFQPGLTDARVEELFAPLVERLPAMSDAAMARQVEPIAAQGPFPAAAQKALARELIEAMGFDFDRGRLDESTHPFCGGSPGDVRITSRYDENDPAIGLMGVLHETGHALYEAGRPKAWIGQPVGAARGMAVHESQSLLIEMQVCRSPEYIRHLASKLDAALGPDPAFAPANLIALYHKVDRGWIRVNADETTYPLHIVLRHELERAMIRGDLAIEDLPGAWNEGFARLFGKTPPDDRMGCLQDIHWPSGGIGYFPSYTLGAIMAAQLFDALKRALPDALEAVERGDFAPVLGWLRTHVHERGSLVDVETLVLEATGARLSSDAFLAHLERRYGGAAP